VGAYIMSYLLHKNISYSGIFIIAGIALAFGCVAVAFAKNNPEKA
jgi:hypothetical protein